MQGIAPVGNASPFARALASAIDAPQGTYGP